MVDSHDLWGDIPIPHLAPARGATVQSRPDRLLLLSEARFLPQTCRELPGAPQIPALRAEERGRPAETSRGCFSVPLATTSSGCFTLSNTI